MNEQHDLSWVHVTQLPDYSGPLDKKFLGIFTQKQVVALGSMSAVWIIFFMLFVNILAAYIGMTIPFIAMAVITVALVVIWGLIFLKPHYDYDHRLMYYNDTYIMIKRRYNAGEEYGRYINKLEDHGPEYLSHDHWI